MDTYRCDIGMAGRFAAECIKCEAFDNNLNYNQSVHPRTVEE